MPRGGHLKRRADGSVDYISPLPSPFNYGGCPEVEGGDGDPLDALVLGPRLPRDHERRWPAWAVVRFRDDGQVDDKWVCGPTRPTPADQELVERFFRGYALVKGWLNRLRGKRGETRFLGWEDLAAS